MKPYLDLAWNPEKMGDRGVRSKGRVLWWEGQVQGVILALLSCLRLVQLPFVHLRQI